MVVRATKFYIRLYGIYRNLKALGLIGNRREMSLQLMLKILNMGLCSLHLALLIYIGIIYTFICLNLTNIKLLIRLNATRLLLKISTIIYILLLTGCITALIYLRSTCLWVYLMALTFCFNISGKYKVVAIYMVFYGVY